MIAATLNVRPRRRERYHMHVVVIGDVTGLIGRIRDWLDDRQIAPSLFRLDPSFFRLEFGTGEATAFAVASDGRVITGSDARARIERRGRARNVLAGTSAYRSSRTVMLTMRSQVEIRSAVRRLQMMISPECRCLFCRGPRELTDAPYRSR